MEIENDINRFLEPSDEWYSIAITKGLHKLKSNHWIWFMFPQLRGLGYSYYSWFYGICSVSEAKDYLAHPVLGKRLRKFTNILLSQKKKNANIKVTDMFSDIDAIRVRSCMTLFDSISHNDIFYSVIDQYFKSKRDEETLKLLSNESYKCHNIDKEIKRYKGFVKAKSDKTEVPFSCLSIYYTPEVEIKYGKENINHDKNVATFLESVKKLWIVNQKNISCWINDILLDLYTEDEDFRHELLDTPANEITWGKLQLNGIPQGLAEQYLFHIRAFHFLAKEVINASQNEYYYLLEQNGEGCYRRLDPAMIHPLDETEKSYKMIKTIRELSADNK